MDRPDREVEDWIRLYEQVIKTAAWRLSNSAEYDDLYQEGQIAVWKLFDTQPDEKVVSAAVYNRMRNWVRYTKRLYRDQSVSYEEVVDGLHNPDGGEHDKELPPVGDAS